MTWSSYSKIIACLHIRNTYFSVCTNDFITSSSTGNTFCRKLTCWTTWTFLALCHIQPSFFGNQVFLWNRIEVRFGGWETFLVLLHPSSWDGSRFTGVSGWSKGLLRKVLLHQVSWELIEVTGVLRLESKWLWGRFFFNLQVSWDWSRFTGVLRWLRLEQQL